MCLAIPGKILSVQNNDSVFRSGKVSFDGILKDVNLAFVPDAVIGDYVIVHVGVALKRVQEDEAHEVFRYLKEMGEIDTVIATRAATRQSAEIASPSARNDGRGTR